MENKNHALTLSLGISLFLAVFCIAAIFFYPSVLRWYFTFRRMSENAWIPLLTVGYGCITAALAALAFLIRLLKNIKTDIIFTTSNIRLLSGLSYCCLTVTGLSVIGTFFYPPLCILIVASFFLFLILRVIGSVFISAAAIKDENDMTI